MKKIVGYATGVFDLFHIGHLNILKQAKAECDYLIVGVTTDELAEKIKGRRPIAPLRERMEIVRSLKCVDRVVPQKEIDEIKDYQKLKFNLIFKGDDWKGTEKWSKLERYFTDKNVKVVYFPYTKTTSSRAIRKFIQESRG